MTPCLDPVVAREIAHVAGLEPVELYTDSRTPWRCVCIVCGNPVTTRLHSIKSSIANGTTFCRYCSGRTQDPDKAVEILRQSGAEPIEAFPGSQKRWRSRCLTCRREVTPLWQDIKDGYACKYCAKRATHPDDALVGMRAANVEPIGPFPGSREPWPCVCNTCGREVSPRWDNIRTRRPVSACKYCAGKAVDADETASAMRIIGLEPRVPYPGRNDIPWSCRCTTCGREVAPEWRCIKRGQGGCKYCAGKVPYDPGVATAMMRKSGAVPISAYPGYNVPWLCLCAACGREITPCLASIKVGNGPCRYCAPRGFDPKKEGFVYLLVHPTFGAAKIGITETSGFRIRFHARHDWQAIVTVRVPGELAVAIEKVILSWWRKGLDLPPYLSKNEMPQGGWTETVDADAIDIPATIERIRALAAAGKTGPIAA